MIYSLFISGRDGQTPSFWRLAASLEDARKLVTEDWGRDRSIKRDDTYLNTKELRLSEIRVVGLSFQGDIIPLEQYCWVDEDERGSLRA